jgi:hypothetical protein
MRTEVGEGVGVEVDLNMAMATGPGHILVVFREVGTDCLERNQRSRNQVLDIHMLLLQVWCILGREVVGWTRENMSENACCRTASEKCHSPCQELVRRCPISLLS